MKKSNIITLAILIIVTAAVLIFAFCSHHDEPDAAPTPEPTSTPVQTIEPMATPKPTKPVETKPAPAKPAETKAPKPSKDPTPVILNDTLFVGDSRTVGIREYSGLKGADFFCSVGMNVFDVTGESLSVDGVGNVTLSQLLSKKQYSKIYIMLGINELGNDLDDITAKFSSLVDTVRAAQPDAIIFVEANLHVGPSRSSTDATFNNPRINQLNEKLAALADGKTIFYIDINELFDDENGNLRADASGDSTHVYAKYDLDWCDWLCTKAIVR